MLGSIKGQRRAAGLGGCEFGRRVANLFVQSMETLSSSASALLWRFEAEAEYSEENPALSSLRQGQKVVQKQGEEHWFWSQDSSSDHTNNNLPSCFEQALTPLSLRFLI